MSGVEGWIDWHGGENPVPGLVVQVQWRDQSARYTPDDESCSDEWKWGHHDMYCDIIAYRVVTPAALSAIEGGGGALQPSASVPTEQADGGVVATHSELVEALRRQTDNMAFVLNRVDLQAWGDKFEQELTEDRGLLTPPATPIAGGLTDLGVHVPADWLQGIWNMGNDALKRLPSDPQGALVSLTGAMMALHPLISENCQHDAAARRDEGAGQ
jgi:hypothetical protein